MKNFFKAVISSILLTLAISTNASAIENVPEVKSEGMILIDVATGEVLAEKNSKEKFAPASTTKIMTALLTLENTKLDDIVTIGENPPFAEGSSIALKEGDMYTVENLLHALLLESANDSAMALAEHIAGSEQEFAKMMNKRAKELGAKNTNFVNSSGLFEENHYTTANDLSLIMKKIIKYDDYLRISKVISYELPTSKVDGQTKWVNNPTTMLNSNNSNYKPELLAGKTGYTQMARFSYVAAAQKNNQQLVSVLLKSESKYENFDDTMSLFDYGFNNFNLVKIYDKNETVTTVNINKKTEVPLIATEDIYYLVDNQDSKLTRGKSSLDESGIKTSLTLEQKDLSKQSFNKGDVVLTADLLINNKSYKNIALASGIANEYSALSKMLDFVKSYIIYIGLAVLAIIAFIFVLKDKLFYLKYRKRAKKIIFKSRKNKLRL